MQHINEWQYFNSADRSTYPKVNSPIEVRDAHGSTAEGDFLKLVSETRQRLKPTITGWRYVRDQGITAFAKSPQTANQDLAPVQLARLCAQKDSEAWLEFIERYQRPITLVILRTLREAGGTATLLIDDLVQETYAALCADGCRLLRDFVEDYPNSLDAMVRVVAVNLTHDCLRAQNAKKRGGDFHHVAYDSPEVAKLLSPNSGETIERHMQLKEIDATLREDRERPTASARNYAIFWLHFHFGMSPNSIARMSRFHLTSKGVESSLRRTVDMLKKTVGEKTQALRPQSDSWT